MKFQSQAPQEVTIKALQTLLKTKTNKYDYDSDEDTESGTWEHKQRNEEIKSTLGTLVVSWDTFRLVRVILLHVF